MEKILLIGDSIRAGYDSFVKKAFEGVADVVYPNENCRFTSYILRNLADWAESLGCDENTALVHWNAGLWDDLTMMDGKPLVRAEVYAENIERIDDMMRRLFPKARFIFATSTPVQEHLFASRRNKRYNRDTEAYNALAVSILQKRGVAINDLYALLKDAPAEYHSDLTHYYTKEGTRLIADTVIDKIAHTLSLTPQKLDYDAIFAAKYDVVGI